MMTFGTKVDCEHFLRRASCLMGSEWSCHQNPVGNYQLKVAIVCLRLYYGELTG